MEATACASSGNLASDQSDDSGSETEDILHICAFCDRNFSNFKQYNLHLNIDHLSQSFKSSKPPPLKTIHSFNSENQCNTRLQHPYRTSSIIFNQREVHHSKHHTPNPLKFYNKKLYSEDSTDNFNMVKNEDVFNKRTDQVLAEMNAINNSDRLVIDVTNSCSSNCSNFSKQICLETRKSINENELIASIKNELCNQPSLSSIMNSCSNIFGEAVELEFKIRLCPGKGNIDSHENTHHTNHSMKRDTVLTHSNRSTTLFPYYSQKDVYSQQNNLNFHQHDILNEQSNTKSGLINHQPRSKSCGSYCNLNKKYSPSNKEANTVSNCKQGNILESAIFDKCIEELSNDSSDIIIIEDLYVCEICKLSFCEKDQLQSHLCAQSTRQTENNLIDIHTDKSKKLHSDSASVRHVSGSCKPKGATLSHVKCDEKEIAKDNFDGCRVEVQYSCNTCSKDFTQTIELDPSLCNNRNEGTIIEKDSETLDFHKKLFGRDCLTRSEPPLNTSFRNRNVHGEKMTSDDVDLCIINTPYSCDICKRDFSQKSEYNSHFCSRLNSQGLMKEDLNQRQLQLESNSIHQSDRNENETNISLKTNEHMQSNLLNINYDTQEDGDDYIDVCGIETLFTCNICSEEFSGKREFHFCTRKEKNKTFKKIAIDHQQRDFDSKDCTQEIFPQFRSTPDNLNVGEVSFDNLDMSIITYPIYCDQCDKGFFEVKDLDIHANSCNTTKNTKYKKSPRNARSKKRNVSNSQSKKRKDALKLTQHKKLRSNKKSEGAFSNKDFSNSSSVSAYTCHICKKDLVDQNNLDTHLQKHVKKETLLCIFCNKTFVSYNKLMEHVTLHADEKLYFCEKCSQGFVQEESLKMHVITHKTQKPYICNICGKSFTRKDSLQRHSRQHIVQTTDSGKKSLGCHSKLRKRTHSIPGRPFCKHCRKTFATIRNLKSHLKLHKFPFNCNVCSAGFRNRIVLEKHLNRHSNIRSHVCLICYRGFFNNQDLQRHMLIHTGERPYECELCEKSFSQYSSKEAHKKNAHKKSANKQITALKNSFKK